MVGSDDRCLQKFIADSFSRNRIRCCQSLGAIGIPYTNEWINIVHWDHTQEYVWLSHPMANL